MEFGRAAARHRVGRARAPELEKLTLTLWLLPLIGFSALSPARGETVMGHNLPEREARLTRPRTPEDGNGFRPPVSRTDWDRRRRELREQILVAAGLWPMLPKSPLRPQVYGRIQREGYTIEKVVLCTLPGFYLCGNLYRPSGFAAAGAGRFPGVLCPHGHWAHGRFEDVVQARGVGLARLGCVAFHYDMIGYADSKPFGHTLRDSRMDRLGMSLGGLQLWNSLRALDFLRSLPDVDPDRIACTGASGGGTQTFLLTAVDDRVHLSAPVCMVSTGFQGGCECENSPSLRIDTDNVEIAAAAAPRPLFLVGATGDWTKEIVEKGFPEIQATYRLLDHPERTGVARFDAGHNYNQQSREAVYGWSVRWLLGRTDGQPVHEAPFTVESEATLSCYDAQHPRPADEADPAALKATLTRMVTEQAEALAPKSAGQWRRARALVRVGLRRRLAVRVPEGSDILTESGPEGRLVLGRSGAGDRIPAYLWPSDQTGGRAATLVVGPEIGGNGEQSSSPLIRHLREGGQTVLAIGPLGVGEHGPASAPGDGFFTTYNRTLLAEQVQDVLTALAYLRGRPDLRDVNLVGEGSMGPVCLLARALDARVARTAVDADAFEYTADGEVPAERALPGILRFGGLRAAAALAAPGPLLLHHTGGALDPAWARQAYELAGHSAALRTSTERLPPEEVVAWLMR
jgi:dienelactone hydrolase